VPLLGFAVLRTFLLLIGSPLFVLDHFLRTLQRFSPSFAYSCTAVSMAAVPVAIIRGLPAARNALAKLIFYEKMAALVWWLGFQNTIGSWLTLASTMATNFATKPFGILVYPRSSLCLRCFRKTPVVRLLPRLSRLL
jgi:hypothetical protein